MTDNNNLDRRTFLRLSGGGLVACTATGLLAQVSEAPGKARSAPSRPVILKSPALEVVLDGSDGLPFEYRMSTPDTRFLGEEGGQPMTATVCQRDGWKFPAVPLRVESVKHTATQADFGFTARVGGQPAASFTISYLLDGSTVTVKMRNVREHAGYDLIEVAMPSLVTVRESDGAAWLAHGDSGGSLAMLRDASPAHLAPNRFWGNVLATLPVVMVGNGTALCVQEVTAFMDGTELRVSGENGSRRGSLGTTKTHRINGSLCYDMNAGNGAPLNCGARNTPNLLVDQESSCRLDFVAGGNGGAGWLKGAELVRGRMPPIPKHLYDDTFTYGILCDQPLFEKPTATFEDCERIIRNVAALTDHAPQIVHLWGWQFRGKDTGYPAVNEVNPRIGGYEGMMRLMQRARAFNCTVTLSDNYDDAYRSSPAWNADWIARRPDGELWESRNWTGENSYILGMAKYVKAAALERVRYTCSRYRLPATTHVDVLSYYSIRNDWDPAHPASGVENLQARYKILEEFAKHGVDVSSEALRYAFLGKISSFWYMTGPGKCPFGGTPIPLLATIYRKSAVWGQSGRMDGLANGILKMLFYNGYAHASFRDGGDLRATTDLYYLMMVPWFKLHGRNVESFRREGDRTVVELEGNAVADMDWAKQTYTVSIDGSEVARDLATYCPLDDHRIAFYSASARELSAPLPAGWDAGRIAGSALSASGREAVPVTVRDGRVVVAVDAQTPVIVYRDSGSIPQASL